MDQNYKGNNPYGYPQNPQPGYAPNPQARPQPGYPQSGYAPNPQQGRPQPGYPQPGYPQPGYAPNPQQPQPGYGQNPRPNYVEEDRTQRSPNSQYHRDPQGNYPSMDYTVDMVFCIDATGSMEDASGSQTRIINMVKKNALNFYRDFNAVMTRKEKKVRQLRVRIIAFRDYKADGEQAMMVTDFFQLPQDTAAFEACINSIHADGGGDIPEDGLEALAYAIKSPWTQEGTKKRQVIVVWTDASTHPLGFGQKSPHYPKGMPTSLAQLSDWWDDPKLMRQNAKRLVLFAPDEDYWNYISRNWDPVVHVPSVAGNGLAEQSYSEILDVVANSV